MFNKEGSMFNKQTITAFVLGIIVAVFVSHAYIVYQVRVITFQNQVAITEIVNFINGQTTPQVSPEVTPVQ